MLSGGNGDGRELPSRRGHCGPRDRDAGPVPEERGIICRGRSPDCRRLAISLSRSSFGSRGRGIVHPRGVAPGGRVQKSSAEAEKNRVSEIIVLACSSKAGVRRPHAALLESFGYEPAPDDLACGDAKQYRKQLEPLSISKGAMPSDDVWRDGKQESKGTMADAAIAVLLLITVLLITALAVANLLGLEVGLTGRDNNGIGTPLSTQELWQLQRDKQLKHTDLDASMGRQQQWNDLATEELREEAALMKIIQGEDVRSQR